MNVWLCCFPHTDEPPSGMERSAHVQGDHSTCSKPPVDFRTKVPFWLGQARTGQTKAELLF